MSTDAMRERPFVSACCEGERCMCGRPAVRKVAEVIHHDDPNPSRHELTAYVCADHFIMVMGAYTGLESLAFGRPPLRSAPAHQAPEPAGWWRPSPAYVELWAKEFVTLQYCQEWSDDLIEADAKSLAEEVQKLYSAPPADEAV